MPNHFIENASRSLRRRSFSTIFRYFFCFVFLPLDRLQKMRAKTKHPILFDPRILTTTAVSIVSYRIVLTVLTYSTYSSSTREYSSTVPQSPLVLSVLDLALLLLLFFAAALSAFLFRRNSSFFTATNN